MSWLDPKHNFFVPAIAALCRSADFSVAYVMASSRSGQKKRLLCGASFFFLSEDDTFFSSVFSILKLLESRDDEEKNGNEGLSLFPRERLHFYTAKQKGNPRRHCLINKSTGAGSKFCKVESKACSA